MSLIPLPYRILGGILLIVSAFALGFFRGASSVRDEVRAAEARTEVLAAKLQAEQANQSVKVVTEYVDREKVVERNVPVVRERVVRLCNEASHPGVPSGPSDPHAPAAPDTSDRQADDLAADLIACKGIKNQLEGLIAWKKSNGG